VGTDEGLEPPHTDGNQPPHELDSQSGASSVFGGAGLDGCGFVVVGDPERVMREWLAACGDADRVRAALDRAGLGPVFGTVRAEVNVAGDPVVVLGGVATAPDVARLLELLAPAPGALGRVCRADGAA
jgi:hypothetical protein